MMIKRICILVSLLFAAVMANAQNYSVDWYSIDGGGGTSTSAVYTVTGTVGQPDAGRMSGGNYAIEGGFWGIIAAVQSVGAPQLRIQLTSSNAVIVAWSAPSTGFSLQQNNALGNNAWMTVTNAVTVTGGENRVIVTPAVGNRFFRLQSP